MLPLTKFILKLILLLFTLGITSSFSFNKVGIEDTIKKSITEYVTNKLGYNVEVNEVKLSPNINLKIGRITLSDSEGAWLILDKIKLSLTLNSQSSLIPTIKLEVNDLIYLRHPKTAKKSNQQTSDLNFNIPINSFSINNLVILPKSTDTKDFSSSVTGFLNLINNNQKLEFNANIVLPKIPHHPYYKQTDVNIKGHYDITSNVVELTNINSKSDLININGRLKLNLNKEEYNGRINFNNVNLHKLSEDFKGNLDSSIVIDGTNSYLNFKTTSNGSIIYKSLDPIDITGSSNGMFDLFTKNGKLLLNLKNGISGNLDFSYLDNLIKFNKINLKDQFSNTIDGNITISKNNKSLLGELKLNGVNLNPYHNKIKGSYKVLGQFTHKISSGQNFDFKINSLEDNKCSPSFSIQSSCNDIDFGTLSATLNNMEFRYGTYLHIKSSGGYINLYDKSLELNPLSGSYDGIKLESANKITIKEEGEILNFNIPTIRAGAANINARGTIRDTNILANINFTLPIKSITSNFLSSSHKLTGNISSNLSLYGNITNPTIDGTLDITDANYKSLDLGLEIKNISAHFIGKNNVISTSKCNFYDNNNALHTCKGEIQLDAENKNLNFTINVSDFFISIPAANIKGSVEADLTLNANLDEAKLTGTIASRSLEIKIPKHFNAGIPELHIIDVNPDNCNISSNYPFILDINFTVLDKLFIRGRGVNAELDGNIKIKGVHDNISVEGKLTTIRGTYEEFEKNFNISKGELVFHGPLPPSPFLEIVGIHNNPEAQVSLKLSGPLLKPILSVSSNPPLSTEEILSIILFGKNTKEISPYQVIMLANNIRRLTGKGGDTDFNILGKVQKLLGIDEVVINFDEINNSSSIQIGKHLSEKVRLKVEKGSKDGTAKTIIEYDMLPNVSVDGEIGEEGYGGVGLNWKRDF